MPPKPEKGGAGREGSNNSGDRGDRGRGRPHGPRKDNYPKGRPRGGRAEDTQGKKRSRDTKTLEITEGEGERRKFVPWLGEERPTKAPILNLDEWKSHKVFVEFAGGRQVEGILTGFDSSMNMILEEVLEDLGSNGNRQLGTVILVGAQVQSVAPIEL